MIQGVTGMAGTIRLQVLTETLKREHRTTMTPSVTFPNEPVIQPVPGSARSFELLADFGFVLDGVPHVISKGFTTDFASIPPRLQGFLANDDPRILRPAIVHDQICDARGDAFDRHFDSIEAAEVLREGMANCGASEALRDVIFFAVALEGPHWK